MKADDTSTELMHAPLSVLPSPFSKEAFEKVTSVQVLMNTMIKNLMENIPRVRELFGELAEKDPFVAGILKISRAVEQAEHKQKGYLGILRNDYMLDDATKQPKLIEINTIASSFGALSWGVNQLHKHLITEHNMDIDLDKVERKKNPHLSIVEALFQAYNMYFDVYDDCKHHSSVHLF